MYDYKLKEDNIKHYGTVSVANNLTVVCTVCIDVSVAGLGHVFVFVIESPIIINSC